MGVEQRFRDEWLVKLTSRMPQIPAGFIEQTRTSGTPFLAQALVAAGLMQPEEIGRIVQQAYRIEFVSPGRDEIDRSALRMVPERLCRSYMLLPVRADQRSIAVAMANPLDMEAERDVGSVTGRSVKPYYCLPARVEELLARLLSPDQVIFDLLDRVQAMERVELIQEEGADRDAAQGDAVRDPVIRLVDAILSKAVQMRASDIHIEQEERVTNVRYRVDGLLRNSMVLPRYIGVGPVVSRIKIMSKLDVADRRRPQDGRAKIRVGRAEIGLRVSTLPTALGEKVVIRILDERSAFIPLDRLGLRQTIRGRVENLIRQEQGILLVTGPTGSGKTSTLYAIANTLLSEDTNIVTVEDPVEYRLKGINQVQVNDKQGLTFPSVLRSVLRQDPDIILVGEIRDRETADIACQAALTGHLVLSTLHTNDSVTSLARLVDMGVDRYKIAAGVIGVAAQRLVRKLCPSCRREMVDHALPAAVRAAMVRRKIAARAFEADGCEACDDTGYRGRIALFELLEVTPEIRKDMGAGATLEEIGRRARETGALHPMSDDALSHLSDGDITLDDALPYLEIADAPAHSAGPSAQPVPASKTPPDARVLIAIADEAARTRFSVALASAGYRVEAVVDGVSALINLAQRAPDVLVADLALPGVGGPDLFRRARSEMALPSLVLVATGDRGKERARQAFEAGADDFVALTAPPSAVSSRVKSALERRGDFSPTGDIMRPRVPANENARLAALRATGVLDTPAEERFDTITRLAQRLFDVPVALVSLVDANRQWFKSHAGIDATETPREIAFCAHAINGDEVFVVPDAALDPRFAENVLVTGEPYVRFYAGCPLNGPAGEKLGTLCIVDRRPRTLSAADLQTLRDLAQLVERELHASGAVAPTCAP